MLNRLQWQWEIFPYSLTEKIGVFKTALTFVDSVSEIWSPLLTGSILLFSTFIPCCFVLIFYHFSICADCHALKYRKSCASDTKAHHQRSNAAGCNLTKIRNRAFGACANFTQIASNLFVLEARCKSIDQTEVVDLFG